MLLLTQVVLRFAPFGFTSADAKRCIERTKANEAGQQEDAAEYKQNNAQRAANGLGEIQNRNNYC